MKELQNIIEAFAKVQREAATAVLATVVKVSGSTYRRAGARMFITQDGQTIGTVSGGCLERDVFKHAAEVLQTNEPRLVTYDSTSDDDIVWGFGLGCNGAVDVLIEPLSGECAQSQLDFLSDCMRLREEGVIATVFAVEGDTGVKIGSRLMMRSGQQPVTCDIVDDDPGSDFISAILSDSQDVLVSCHSKLVTYEMRAGSAEAFIESIQPPVPLLVFGAGYDAVPLVQIAKELGWYVTLVDGRPDFATQAKFPAADAFIITRPEDVAERVQIDRKTMAVVMTHNYLDDYQLLETLLPSPARYIGLLGPKRRTEQLLYELKKNGTAVTDEQLNRLYGPVGIDIGADAPEEIAVAILAEIKTVLADRSAGLSRDRKEPLHKSIEEMTLSR
ncbi:MAG: XdhC family protein [Pyrinomonadaceae bacterium]